MKAILQRVTKAKVEDGFKNRGRNRYGFSYSSRS